LLGGQSFCEFQRLRDFFYFYDLYVLSGALLAGLGLYLWSSGR